MIVCSNVKFSKTEGVHMYHAGDVAGMGLNADALVLIALLAGGLFGVSSCVWSDYPLQIANLPHSYRVVCVDVASRQHMHLHEQG
jgi:hypothetical protein